MAERWGKIIIEEAFLPPQYRTINPIDVGGQAGASISYAPRRLKRLCNGSGGEKYFYNGILFKLQTDWKHIYGGDFHAMKTGGLELKVGTLMFPFRF